MCLQSHQNKLIGEEGKPVPARLGCASTATVLIVDDDHAGAFGFTSEKFKVAESKGIFIAEVTVVNLFSFALLFRHNKVGAAKETSLASPAAQIISPSVYNPVLTLVNSSRTDEVKRSRM